MDAAKEFDSIRQAWPEAQFRADGSKPAVFLPNFCFESAGTTVTMDLLLYPQQHGGYVTRLFFRKQLSRGPNWTAHFVCGETWWTPSWNNVHPEQPWTSMLANLLKAVV
ncbi:MAG: hypothetical protein ACLQAT_01045 [Candidatus Binataceae bacterium]